MSLINKDDNVTETYYSKAIKKIIQRGFFKLYSTDPVKFNIIKTGSMIFIGDNGIYYNVYAHKENDYYKILLENEQLRFVKKKGKTKYKIIEKDNKLLLLHKFKRKKHKVMFTLHEIKKSYIDTDNIIFVR